MNASSWASDILEMGPWPVLSAAAAVVIYFRGWLRAAALSDGPSRRTDLSLMDVGAGLLLLNVLAVMAAVSWKPVSIALDLTGEGAWAKAGVAIFGQVTVQLPLVCFVMWRAGFSRAGLRELGALPRDVRSDVLTGVVGLLLALPLVMGVSFWTAIIGEAFGSIPPRFGHDLLKVMVGSESAAARWILIVSAVVLAPLLEEFVFRGLVQSGLSSVMKNRWAVVVISSLFFAGIHTVAWQALPGLFVLGVVLGWVYEKRGSLWPSVLIHAGFNAANVAMALALGAE
jgi:membrane protease YdiL (CAAX protease family)